LGMMLASTLCAYVIAKKLHSAGRTTMNDDVKPATDAERRSWDSDAALGFVRPFRGEYVRDTTVVAKIRALNAAVVAERARANALEGAHGELVTARGELIRDAKTISGQYKRIAELEAALVAGAEGCLRKHVHKDELKPYEQVVMELVQAKLRIAELEAENTVVANLYQRRLRHGKVVISHLQEIVRRFKAVAIHTRDDQDYDLTYLAGAIQDARTALGGEVGDE